MVSRRSYGSYNDGCASAHALDLVGDRWTLIVVRELLLGPKRFSDLERDIIGIGPAVLTQRLQDLTARGIAERHRLPGPGRADAYELTAWGYQLEAVNTALSAWAVASPDLPRDADMSADTLVLAMRAHARPLPGLTHEWRVSLNLSDSRRADAEPVEYLARVTERGAEVVKTFSPQQVDATVAATTREWKSCVIGGVALEDAPGLHVEGSVDAVHRLIDATSLAGPSLQA
ncbi:helix-turn-helix transcriptional regulator [Ruania alkalisoli]|uniref:Helix-turn-helix transcriptional regulator n=1 Tax=Ruania alkalisoli TaxID=2779775 RepID=A0A7M1SYB1_9MICO|nr:helix-turn-helix domain-containing protein [Ruania alkalisoli]QOR71742.1 helix-turn-helix transcriptional regulator [Ruania alkalisoli]